MEIILLLTNDFLPVENIQNVQGFLNLLPSGRFLEFKEYLNLRMTCSMLYTYIGRFLCFNVNINDYMLYKQITATGDLFLFYNNSPANVQRFLQLFGYVYGQIETEENEEYFFRIKRGPSQLSDYYTDADEFLNAIPYMNITPLHSCIRRDFEMFKILAPYGDIGIRDADGNTPLHKTLGNFQLVKYIIDNFEVDLNAVNDFDESIFIIACIHEECETVKLLLSRGVNPCQQSMPINDLILEVIDIWRIVKLLVRYIDFEHLELLYNNIRRRYEQTHHIGSRRAIMYSVSIINKHVDSHRI